MDVLRLYLSPYDDNMRMKVFVDSYGESESVVPFNGQSNRRATMLKALDASYFDPQKFPGVGEQKWMVKVGLLATNRRFFHPDMCANIGKLLYESLFPKGSKAEAALRDARVTAGRNQEESPGYLHLKIGIEADVARYARLFDYPWELLHDGQDFLAAHGIAISRCINYKAPPPTYFPVDRVNVLLVSSSAFDQDNGLEQLPSEDDLVVRAGLQKAQLDGLIDLVERKHITLKTFRKYLSEHTEKDMPHIIHFDGHGHFGKRCKNVLPSLKECRTFHPGTAAKNCRNCEAELPPSQGYLLFEDESGRADYVSAREMSTTLGLNNAGRQQGIALVVLSACKSGLSLAEESVFNGVAQSLISHKIPAVLAMHFSVTTNSVEDFTEQFYCALGMQNSFVRAVSQGRVAMRFDGNQWYRPVLYLRWKDNEGGRLFAAPHQGELAAQDTKRRKILRIRQPRPDRFDKGKLPSVSPDLSISRKKVNSLANAQKSLQVMIDETFNKESVIWQSHCEQVINAIKKVEKVVSSLRRAIDEPDGFPTAPSRADKMRLDNISAQITNLYSLLSAFSAICPPSSSQLKGLQYDEKKRSIGLELNRLIDNTKTLKTSLELLLRQVD